MTMLHRAARALVPALCALFVALPLRAAPPARELLRELDAFRERAGVAPGTWRGDGFELESGSWDEASAIATFGAWLEAALPPTDAETTAALLACLLTCPELVDGAEAIAGTPLDRERVALTFALEPAERLIYTIGTAVQAGDLAVELERDTYRPSALIWVSSRGVVVRLEAADYEDDGWTLRRVRVRVGSGSHGFVGEIVRVR